MTIVPVSDRTRMTIVLMKPMNMWPLFQAVTKLSKFSQLPGAVIGWLLKNSA